MNALHKAVATAQVPLKASRLRGRATSRAESGIAPVWWPATRLSLRSPPAQPEIFSLRENILVGRVRRVAGPLATAAPVSLRREGGPSVLPRTWRDRTCPSLLRRLHLS